MAEQASAAAAEDARDKERVHWSGVMQNYCDELERDIQKDRVAGRLIPGTQITLTVWKTMRGYPDFEKDLYRKHCPFAEIIGDNGGEQAREMQKLRLKRKRWKRAKQRKDRKERRRAKKAAIPSASS